MIWDTDEELGSLGGRMEEASRTAAAFSGNHFKITGFHFGNRAFSVAAAPARSRTLVPCSRSRRPAHLPKPTRPASLGAIRAGAASSGRPPQFTCPVPGPPRAPRSHL